MLLGVIVVAVGIAVSLLSLFMLAMDEVVGTTKIPNVDSTKIVSINMVVNISPLMF